MVFIIVRKKNSDCTFFTLRSKHSVFVTSFYHFSIELDGNNSLPQNLALKTKPKGTPDDLSGQNWLLTDTVSGPNLVGLGPLCLAKRSIYREIETLCAKSEGF